MRNQMNESNIWNKINIFQLNAFHTWLQISFQHFNWQYIWLKIRRHREKLLRRASRSRSNRGSGVVDVGDESVTVGVVVDGLDSAVGEGNEVLAFSGGSYGKWLM